jgi:hypothetical protein
VTRTRWFTTKIALVGLGVVGVAGLCAVLFTWWRTPLDEIGGRMRTAAFVVAAPSLMAVTLFAFALGVLAGALLRRTIPAMVATLVTYLTVRITTEESLRAHYLTPRSRTTDPTAGADQLPRTDWTVTDAWVDSTGHRLTDSEKTDLLNTIYAGSGAAPDGVVEKYLAAHGMRHYTEYHPASSFWTFQAIEAALFSASRRHCSSPRHGSCAAASPEPDQVPAKPRTASARATTIAPGAATRRSWRLSAKVSIGAGSLPQSTVVVSGGTRSCCQVRRVSVAVPHSAR